MPVMGKQRLVIINCEDVGVGDKVMACAGTAAHKQQPAAV